MTAQLSADERAWELEFRAVADVVEQLPEPPRSVWPLAAGALCGSLVLFACGWAGWAVVEAVRGVFGW